MIFKELVGSAQSVRSAHPTLTVAAGFSLRKPRLAATRLKCNLFNALIKKISSPSAFLISGAIL
jgi:hypothetical protein